MTLLKNRIFSFSKNCKMSDIKSHPIIQGYINWNQFGVLLGMDFIIPEKGKVEYRLKVEEKHLATPRAAHGGVQAALIDATLGVAALSNVCEENRVVSTVSLTINYISPALLGDEMIGTASVIKQGKNLLFVQGEIVNQNGKLLATASATMNAYPVDKLLMAND